MTRFTRIAVAGAAVALLAPSAATAATPTVTTGEATRLTQTTARLNGMVDPNGRQTYTFWQYGTTKTYGMQTPEIDRGDGNARFRVSDDIAGLQPFTTYHYRLVAQYGQRLVVGRDRTFKTKRQPLGISLAVNPAMVRANGETTVSGAISGTESGGREVVLQSNPFPFSGFADTGNPQIADAAGNFAFNVLDVPVNTVFRVRLPDRPNLESPELTVSVRINVGVDVPRKVRRGRKVKFAGRVTPANPGAPALVQRKIRDQWVTWKRTRLGEASRYRTKVRIWKTANWRVLVTPGPAYVSDASPVRTVRARRR